MAHFAELDENNVVQRIVVVSNDDVLDENGNESEDAGINFLENLFGHRKWAQTSYNSNFRYHYAQIGGTYHPDLDGFSEQQPYPSWILNNETLEWESPIPLPEIEPEHIPIWDEENGEWIIVIPPKSSEG